MLIFLVIPLIYLIYYFIKKKITHSQNQWFIFNLINKINKNIKLNQNNKLNNLNYRLKWLLGKWYDQKKIIEIDNKYLYHIDKKYQKRWHRYYTMINSYFKNNNKILFEYGDVNYSIDQPIICKTRPIKCNSNIILPLNINRHWENVITFKLNDIPFQKKKPIGFWRGATIGSSDNEKKELRPGNRFDLMKKWFNKDNLIDIGFSEVIQTNTEYYKYLKEKCNIGKFLEYKYLISVEGNDVASGLKWNLYSNSLVLMPKPKIVSWFMEDHLEPGIHYILIKDDWSDLKEKIEWCEENQDKCLEIIKNANAYVQRFVDEFKSVFA